MIGASGFTPASLARPRASSSKASRSPGGRVIPPPQGFEKAYRMAINFTMFTATPTQAFLDAIKAAGITVRGWEIPPYRFRRRKTLTHTVKTDFGWLDPRDNSGNLKLTIDGERGGEHYG